MRFAELDAVTVDGYGTLLELADPVPRLSAALRERGIERSGAAVAAAFRAEMRYYTSHAQSAVDEPSLSDLRRACAGVFLEAADAALDPREFCGALIDALVFEPVAGAVETLDRLAACGLALAVVANWEISLRHHLRRHGLDRRFASVVISAEIGAAKPDPRPFEAALAELGVEPARALHVGDQDDDEQGARAAGMAFAWAPLVGAFPPS
jgi:FMN phosphatase YigB (HAD superfamily)